METYFANLELGQSAMARERVLQDFKALVHDSESLLKATASDLSEKAKEARARLSGALERAKATCAELQAQTMTSATAAAKKADTVIREHPYESAGMAFGLGVLIGVLLARK
jgi:ElaB/YqjD/DUF883 family membrane-anchored ribosome-binding protein